MMNLCWRSKQSGTLTQQFSSILPGEQRWSLCVIHQKTHGCYCDHVSNEHLEAWPRKNHKPHWISVFTEMSGSGTFGTVLEGTFYGASVVSWHCRTHASSPFWALNPKKDSFAIRIFRSFPSENCVYVRTYIFGKYIVVQCSDIISHRSAANICTYLHVAHTITQYNSYMLGNFSVYVMFTKAPSPGYLPFGRHHHLFRTAVVVSPSRCRFGFDRKRGRQNAEFRQERTAPWWQNSEKKRNERRSNGQKLKES